MTKRKAASAATAVHLCARGDPREPRAGVRGLRGFRPERRAVAPPKSVRTCCKTIALIPPNRAGRKRILSANSLGGSGGSGRSLPGLRSRPPARVLTIRTDPEEFEAVFDLDEAIAAGQGGFDFAEHAAVELDDAIALAAEQVVVLMARGVIIGDFESRQAVSEVDAVDQAHLLEECHATVDGGQVARAGADGLGDFFGCRGAPQPHQSIQDDLTRPGHATRLSSDPLFPLRRKRLVNGAAVSLCFHRTPDTSRAEAAIQGFSPDVSQSCAESHNRISDDSFKWWEIRTEVTSFSEFVLNESSF